MITGLEKLCSPVFQCLCNYWQLSRVTNFVEKEIFLRDIGILLADAKKEAEGNQRLSQEYAWIEKPLVFFIDYMVKEGRFSFRQEWRELARNYSELSGDEKFFDLLSETLEHPDLHNSFALFYIMLGLGFDGAYRYNHEYIGRCMRLCMEKTALEYDIYSEPVIVPPPKKHFFQRRRKLSVHTAVIVSVLFMALCFIVNLAVFITATEDYRETVQHAAAGSAPPQGIK